MAIAFNLLAAAASACALIEDEIRRGCAMLGKDAPAFCTPYRRPS